MSNVFLQDFPNKLADSIRKSVKNLSKVDSKINFWMSLRNRVRELMRLKAYNSSSDVDVNIVTDFSLFSQTFHVMENTLTLNPSIDDIIKEEEKNLKQFFKVSSVNIQDGIATDPSGVDIFVSLSTCKTCKRCALHCKTVGKRYTDICERCFYAVSLDHPHIFFESLFPCILLERRSAEQILDSLMPGH